MSRARSSRDELSRRSLLGALALAALAACRRAAEDAPALAALAVELGIAPVVDDDPWVIAFLTELSIARPDGADARLEGRTGAGGLRRPEPIIEGETREALAGPLAAYERERPRDPSIAAVWQADPFGPEARVRWRLYFVDRRAGFVADAQARASLERGPAGPLVRVRLSEEQGARLAELSAARLERRIAITAGDEVLMLPVVAAPITGGELQLVAPRGPGPMQAPEAAAAALFERLTR